MKRDRSAVTFSLVLGILGSYILLSGFFGWPSLSFASRGFVTTNEVAGFESYLVGVALTVLGVWLFHSSLNIIRRESPPNKYGLYAPLRSPDVQTAARFGRPQPKALCG